MAGLPELSSTAPGFFRMKNIFFPLFSEFELMILHLLAKKNEKVMKTSFYVSRGTFRQNIVFEKKIQRIRFFSRDISDFWRDSLSWILNLPSTCPEEPLRGTKIGEKKDISNRFLGLGRVCVEILAENLQQSFQNCILRIQSMNSRKNFFLSKPKFLRSSRLSRNSFWSFLRKCLRKIIKYAFYVLKGMFWEKFLSWNLCLTITELTRKSFGFLAANLSLRLSKLNPTCPQDPIGEEHFLKYSSIFLDVKIDSFESRWFCCIKTLSEFFFQFLHFWTVSSNFSDFRQNIQWLGCPNCLLRVQRRFLKEKNFCTKKVFSINFWLWADHFRVSGKKISQVYHSLISRTPCKSFWTSCEEFFAGLTFMHYTPQREFSAEFSVWNLRITFTDFMR